MTEGDAALVTSGFPVRRQRPQPLQARRRRTNAVGASWKLCGRSGDPLVPGHKCKTELVIIHAQISGAATRDGARHNTLNLLCEDPDSGRMIVPVVLEAIQRDPIIQSRQQNDVFLQANVGTNRPTTDISTSRVVAGTGVVASADHASAFLGHASFAGNPLTASGATGGGVSGMYCWAACDTQFRKYPNHIVYCVNLTLRGMMIETIYTILTILLWH